MVQQGAARQKRATGIKYGTSSKGYRWNQFLLPSLLQGTWMYEVTLGTCGIQQIGWATLRCPFNNEEGVGDAADSYAWDGKRVQRWNVNNAPYGT